MKYLPLLLLTACCVPTDLPEQDVMSPEAACVVVGQAWNRASACPWDDWDQDRDCLWLPSTTSCYIPDVEACAYVVEHSDCDERARLLVEYPCNLACR